MCARCYEEDLLAVVYLCRPGRGAKAQAQPEYKLMVWKRSENVETTW